MKGVGRVEQFTDWVERVLSLVFVPPTLWGGAGALMRKGRGQRSLRQVFSEWFGGVVTAHMLSPVILEYSPEPWHITLFVLSGLGGLEFVGRLYEAVAQGLENRVRGKIEGRGEE